MKRAAAILIGGGCIALSICPINHAIIPIIAGILIISPGLIKDIHNNPPGVTITLAYILIAIPVILHSVINPTIDNIIGLCAYFFLFVFFFASRFIGRILLIIIPFTALIESIAIICIRSAEPHPSYGGLIGIAHFSCFIIMIGMFTAPQYLKWPIYILGPPAILLTGSEEGLLYLAAGLGVFCWRRDFTKYTITAFITAIIAISVLIPTGHFADTHYKLSSDRFISVGAVSNHRTTGISDNIDISWFYGNGWDWDTTGGRHQTIHNVFLKILSQYGVLAMSGLLIIFIRPLFNKNTSTNFYGITFIMLSSAMVDHFLLTYFMPWPYFVAGIYESEIFVNDSTLINRQQTS